MSDTLTLSKREATGSRQSQKLRDEGHVPAVLYGHKEEALSLSIPYKELRKAISHHAKVVNLSGAASGQAILQEVQWDTFHRYLLHVDLLRVSAGEKVHVTVPLELKGDAAGVNEGGVVEQMVTSIEIEAAPASIPEMLHIDVTNLHLGGSMLAKDIADLPEGATLITSADETVVHCVPPAGAPALDDSVAGGSDEPEVVSKKQDEEESEG
ncbi:50S ribosomal protein L25 [Pseudobythopirellula maris]|uniref:Large ribosomal subunit protein bL25 n=1 Tax=Pseudobythopirellula maris TaxID=2527991 RepID=A0A5C5ZMM0_9BACT|nr:50S ribosomal protein L25 [Pseudobythopirellula maris]TWT88408.1 50S ribosomal protein L25 [Pseudobythopirellula maris]